MCNRVNFDQAGGKAGGDFKADVKRGNESPGWAILTHGRNKDQNIEQ